MPPTDPMTPQQMANRLREIADSIKGPAIGKNDRADDLYTFADQIVNRDPLADLRSHNWIGQRQGSEWVRYCSVCGMEDACEDPLPPCPGGEAK